MPELGIFVRLLPNFQAYGLILLLQSEWNQPAAVLTSVLPNRVEKEVSACHAQLGICIHLYIKEKILEFFHQQQCLFSRFIKIKVTICLQSKKKTLRGSNTFNHSSEKIYIYMIILVKEVFVCLYKCIITVGLSHFIWLITKTA